MKMIMNDFKEKYMNILIRNSTKPFQIISPFALKVFGGSADSCDASRWRNMIGCYFITQKEERVRALDGLRSAHLLRLRQQQKQW